MSEFRTVPSVDGIRRLPRLGKIGLGVKDKTAKGAEYPREVEYFVIREDELSKPLAAKLVAIYGAAPKSLDVVFPSEHVPDFFPSAYRLYGSGAGLRCIGDGESARRIGKLLDKDGDAAGEFFDVECPGEECELYRERSCRRVSSLTFMLPRVSVTGYFQIDTGSFHSRVAVLNDIEMVRNVFGRISGLISKKPPYSTALVLEREAREIQHGGTKRTHYTLRVKIRNSEMLDIEALQRIRLADPMTGLMIEQVPADAPLDLIPARLHPAPATPPDPSGLTGEHLPDGQIPVGNAASCPQCDGTLTTDGCSPGYWRCTKCNCHVNEEGEICPSAPPR